MLDIAYVREHLEEVRERLSHRGFSLDVQTFERLDGERKTLIHEAERLRQVHRTVAARPHTGIAGRA